MTPGNRDRKLESLGYPLDRTPGIGAIYFFFVLECT